MNEENNNINNVSEKPIKENKSETNEIPNTKQTKTKKKGLTISIIIIILAILCGAIGGAVYAIFFAKKEVDLSKYVSIEFTGFEGYASFDEEDLIVDEKGLKKVLEDKKLAKKLAKKITDKAIVEENENLKNGDQIEVKVKISEDWLNENKIKLSSEKFKITIKDLEEPNSLDLFEDLEFTYSGVSPDLTITLNNNSSNDFIKNDVTFYMEKDKNSKSYFSLYDIANGDKIKVTASYDKSDLERAGYATAEDTYTFTVEGQAEYVKNKDDITSEVKKTIESKLSDKAKYIANSSKFDVTSEYQEDFSDISDFNFLSHSDPELQKMYIAINNDFENVGWYDSKNTIYAIYKVVFTDSNTSKNYDFYITTKVEDIITDQDGLYTDKTYYYDEFYNGNYSHRSLDTIYIVIQNELGDNYTLSEI